MAVLQVAAGPDVLNVTVHGAVDRADVDRLRLLLTEASRSTAGVELDLREVTVFPLLAVGVLVSGRRGLGERLTVLCTGEVLELLDGAGLSRILSLAGAPPN